jgi:hypothetical protein
MHDTEEALVNCQQSEPHDRTILPDNRMLRARSGIRRLRPGAAPLSIVQQARLLLHPPLAAIGPSSQQQQQQQQQRGRAFAAAAAALSPSRKRLGTDPLTKIAAVVDYGSSVQVGPWVSETQSIDRRAC